MRHLFVVGSLDKQMQNEKEPIRLASAGVRGLFFICVEKANGKTGKVRMVDFHLSDGHRNCCPFHCMFHRLHYRARKSAESDGIIS